MDAWLLASGLVMDDGAAWVDEDTGETHRGPSYFDHARRSRAYARVLLAALLTADAAEDAEPAASEARRERGPRDLGATAPTVALVATRPAHGPPAPVA